MTAPTTEKNWGAEPARKPKLAEGDVELYSEHGRITGSIDYRSHWFVLVKGQFGGYALLVKHGGGEERTQLGHSGVRGWLPALETMTSDQRYLLLHTIHSAASDAESLARKYAAAYWQTAFIEGRMKRRKKQGMYYVEVLPKETT